MRSGDLHRHLCAGGVRLVLTAWGGILMVDKWPSEDGTPSEWAWGMLERTADEGGLQVSVNDLPMLVEVGEAVQ